MSTKRALTQGAEFSEAPVPMVVVTDGLISTANPAFAGLVGREIDDLSGVRWASLIHGPDGPPRSSTEPIRCWRSDGSTVWVTARFVELADGAQLGWVTDVSDRVAAQDRERALRFEVNLSQRRLRSLVEPSVDLITLIAVDGRIVDANPAVEQAFGAERDGLIGHQVTEMLPLAVSDPLMERVAGVAATGTPTEMWRVWLEPTHAAPGWFVVRLIPEQPGEGGWIESVYVVASDITELVESERRLSKMALVDTLTGVANRAAVLDRLAHALDRLGRRPGNGVAVVVVDLDGFKRVNEMLGHEGGDDALVNVAEAMLSIVRTEDTVGRIGGDEFMVVCEDVADPADALAAGRRIASRLHDIGIAASVGVEYTDSAIPVDEMVALADQAIYEAKRRRSFGRHPSSGYTRPSNSTSASSTSAHPSDAPNAAAVNSRMRIGLGPFAPTITHRME